MQNFGIQIDSLADIVAFGILPVCIGLALWNYSAASAEAGSFVLRASPVTAASLIFPTLVLLQKLTRADLCWLYHAVMLATAGAFVGSFTSRSPTFRGILILVGLGAAEFLLFLILRLVTRHG